MVSKSTKRKNRRNRAALAARASLRLVCIDRRVDFWLISAPDPRAGRLYHTCHLEVYGKVQALRKLRQLIDAFPITA